MRELLPSVKFTEKGWPDWWYFGREGKLVKDDDVDDEVDKVGGLVTQPSVGL